MLGGFVASNTNYCMNNIVGQYANEYGVEYVNRTSGRAYSVMKERIGERYIETNGLFQQLFPGYFKHTWVRDREIQLHGVDVIVHTTDDDIFIDIKCCIGEDYDMTIPLELTNKGKDGKWRFTNTFDKKTHYMLYVVMDKHGTRHHLIPYGRIMELSKDSLEHRKIYTSWEGSAQYVKIPVSEI